MADRAQLTVRGVDFTYLEAGPTGGPLALCLHGFPDHAPTFESLLQALAAEGYHAVAPWMRGYAPTSVPADGEYFTGTLAADALAIADELAPKKDAVLIGHDWGAGAAYGAAGFRPDRFRKLVTMALPPAGALGARFLTSARQLKRSWYMFFFQMPIAEMAVSANNFAFIDMLWEDWSPGFTPAPDFMAALKKTFASEGSLAAALGYYRAVWGGQAAPAEAQEIQAAGRSITIPSFYLHGRTDGCMGAELLVVEEMKPAFPAGLQVEIVEDAGHFLHLEKPAQVNESILRFLAA